MLTLEEILKVAKIDEQNAMFVPALRGRGDLPPFQRKMADAIIELLTMLKRFARRGEQLWDDENFRDGYKKIPSGDLVDCRELLRQFGITDFDDPDLLTIKEVKMNENTEQAVTENPDAEDFGNPDDWQLLSKFQTKHIMKSTKAYQIFGVGCMVQVSTRYNDSVAEAITFVAGVCIRNNRLEAI